MLAACLTARAGAFGSQAAMASAGDSPKFSFFGFFGNGDTLSEGAMYGSDQSVPTYSPYSVYGKLGDEKTVYKKYNSKEVEFKKAMFAESAKRVAGTKAYIEKKSWEDVRSELERQVYNMRGTMNYLAAAPSALGVRRAGTAPVRNARNPCRSAKPSAKAAAKKFYQDMEEVNLLSKRKKQAAALDAYSAMMSSLEAYTKLI